MLYFGFALSDSMFASLGECSPTRKPLPTEQGLELLKGEFTACLNPSHSATIHALENRFGVVVPIPEKPPLVNLGKGDSLLIFAVKGLPRLTDRHEYTHDEIEKASFSFVLWEAPKTPIFS